MAQVEVSEPTTDERPTPARRRWLGFLVAALAGPLLLATFSAFFGGATWWLDLVAQTRPWLASGLLLLAGMQLLANPKWPAAMWLAGAAVAAVPSLGNTLLRNLTPGPSSDEYIVAVIDAPGSTGDVAALRDWIARTQPDLVIVNGGESPALSGYSPLPVDADVQVLSRDNAMIDAGRIQFADAPAWVEVSVLFEGEPASLLAVTVPPATDAESAARQATAFAGIEAWVAARRFRGDVPIVAGVFNTTPNGRRIRSAAARLDVRVATDGSAWTGTWPSSLPAPLRADVSNALIPSTSKAAVNVGPHLNTPRRPLLIRIGN